MSTWTATALPCAAVNAAGPSVGPLFWWTLTACALALLAVSVVAANARRRGTRPKALLIGNGVQLQTTGALGFAVQGLVPFDGDGALHADAAAPSGSTHDLRRALVDNEIEHVLVCVPENVSTSRIQEICRLCVEAGAHAHCFPPSMRLERLEAPSRVGRLVRNPYRPWRRRIALACKRAMDVAGAAIGIALLLPVLVACALAVKLTSRGPVFFCQTRVGLGNRHFPCFKFRTMRVGADREVEQLRAHSVQDGPAFKIPDDPRLTRIGRLLRRYSLDELPQLFNVLLGDMSLVGPRPPIPAEVNRYTWWQRRRIAVKPGLTCVWQVWGRNRVSFKRWVEMDLYYIDNWSLWLDLKLIAHTVRVVFAGTGM